MRLSIQLTSINWLLCLLRLGTGVVLISRLGSNSSCRAVPVEVAATVHCLLKSVALPSKDVVAVGSSAPITWDR